MVSSTPSKKSSYHFEDQGVKFTSARDFMNFKIINIGIGKIGYSGKYFYEIVKNEFL